MLLLRRIKVGPLLQDIIFAPNTNAMQNYLSKVYYGNSLQQYLIALAIVALGLLFLRLFRKIILNRLKAWTAHTDTKLDDYLVNGFEKFGLPVLNILVVYFSLSYLTLSEKANKVVHAVLVVVITFYLVRFVSAVIRLALESFISRQEKGEEKLKQLNGIMLIINVLVWMLGLLFLFDNLGYNITAIVTGLGIGGIAIALAAQNILGDLFNYFVIFFDRPFEVGDYITVDDKKGTVEHIGIKTTRLLALTGEQLAFSNSDLTKSRIHNFKRMTRRRVAFKLGVVYQTPPEKIKLVPTLIKEAVQSQSLATFDRAHFASFGNFSLDFEVVYFIESPDYLPYMDVQQAINLAILESFSANGIDFAYPTQTVLVEGKALA
jgi:small-conductance mechanosensitive channel